MKAIVLAAGRGERMRPLTDYTPKPLLEAGGRTLIEWQIIRLVGAGIREVVVNVSHLGGQVVDALGDGRRFGAHIVYSHEPEALETAGGIALALPLLGRTCFIAVNADVYCEFEYTGLVQIAQRMDTQPIRRAHLVLVPNPDHHPRGDFSLDAAGCVGEAPAGRLTYSGIGIYAPSFFADIQRGEKRALGPLLHAAAACGELTGERFDGRWMDIGTPARLDQLRAILRDQG